MPTKPIPERYHTVTPHLVMRDAGPLAKRAAAMHKQTAREERCEARA